MKSKRSHEGYLLIDHSNSPGIPDDIGMPLGLPAGFGRGRQELPTLTCNHCQKILIVNPLRNRERPHCRKCDHYICDECNVTRIVTGECRPYIQVVEDQHEKVIKQESLGLIRLA